MKRRSQHWYVETKLFHKDGRRLWTRITKRTTMLRAVRAYRQASFAMDDVRLVNEKAGESYYLTFRSRFDYPKGLVMHLGIV